MQILNWYIYEVTTEQTSIKGVMFRGRLRKLGLKNNVNILAENASDKENCVRFALLEEPSFGIVAEYIKDIAPDSKIELIARDVSNPVLSKMKVNIETRYTL